jgi:flagellar protein FlaI
MATPKELKMAIADIEAARRTLKKPAKRVAEVVEVTEIPPLQMQDKVFQTNIQITGHYTGKLLNEYHVLADKIPLTIKIVKPTTEYVPIYDLYLPRVGDGTSVILENIREEITAKVGIRASEVLDIKLTEMMEQRFKKNAKERLNETIPKLDDEMRDMLADYLVNDMLGLGKMELLLADDALEEVVVNNAAENIWVYHKMHGWLKTNLKIRDEKQIADYANAIGRKAERQINTLNPLMDAHLASGERTNATLFPISTKGNTITIRKFAREPWTIIDFIDNSTVDLNLAAFLWTAMQYEMNILVAGGTASGKTSLLNSMTPFLPPNHRIISIEDTRELRLPEYLHWIPMVTRQSNVEGKGGIEMLDLMVNSLRMRPDRIIVGEIRRHEEAEVLFEAMHTGHSVYATLHANTADEVRRRLVNPPLSIAETLLEALHLVVVQFRHRKQGIRRTLELAEFVPTSEGTVQVRPLFKWRAGQDTFTQVKESVRVIPEIQLFTALTESEINDEIKQKQEILKWLLKNNVRSTDLIGRVVGEYYTNEPKVNAAISKNLSPKALFE